ncbi:hypothetical protein [Priestia koreensis]|uniref:Uncharacterized protein n=1 Tax=Priestia koreensis TaxID=284581 RepID=A0A0M0L5R6_9BACI|nr:hypothetical protein [Priestia koreensis]KOO46416.1 hypothetical protein AMD01_11340 [Priestia koreensis]
MKQGKIEQFQHLSNFSSLKDMNNNMESFLSVHKSAFTASELICFKVLLRFSCKVKGVSNISVNKLLKSISETCKKVSESTFHRMKRKAIKLGILAVIPTERSNKSQSSNLWVFHRFINNDTPYAKDKSLVNKQSEDKPMTPQKTVKHSKTNSHINTRKDNVIKNVPVEFQSLAKCYYSVKEVLELWKCVKHSTKYLTYYTQQDRTELSIRAFKQMICNIKLGYKIKKSIFAYYHGILNGLLDREYEEIVS